MNTILALFAATLAYVGLASPAVAQGNYPDKPIRLIVPYAAGGSTAVLAQTYATMLGDSLGQRMFVEPKPGGNTIIGTQAAKQAAPDGYTLLMTANSHVVVPLMTTAPYDPFKDFIPIAAVAKTEFVLLVTPGLPVQTLQEFIALAKSKPGEVSYASAGNGSGVHLAAEEFAQLTGIKLRHVPYKGSGALINDVVGGHVQAAFQTPAVALPFVKDGRLRAIAITGKDRLAALPNVPTFAQSGVSNFNPFNWFGVFAPVGTPKDVIAKIGTATAALAKQQDFRDKLIGFGLDPYYLSADQFESLMKAESTRMSTLVKSTKITMD